MFLYVSYNFLWIPMISYSLGQNWIWPVPCEVEYCDLRFGKPCDKYFSENDPTNANISFLYFSYRALGGPYRTHSSRLYHIHSRVEWGWGVGEAAPSAACFSSYNEIVLKRAPVGLCRAHVDQVCDGQVENHPEIFLGIFGPTIEAHSSLHENI